MNKFFTSFLLSIFLWFAVCGQQQKISRPRNINKSSKNYSGQSSVQKNTNQSPSTLNKNNVETFSFNGQWKGSFVDNTSSLLGLGGEQIDYVLELETSGSAVNGYSYTYFTEAGKRYYTICKLKGTINRANKEIVVTEYERTKFNTPPDFSNCFQMHKLKYIKESAETELLKGSWMPAPNQNGNCGYGLTTLSRKIIKKEVLVNKTLPEIKKDQPFRDMNRKPEKTVTLRAKPILKNNKIIPADKTAEKKSAQIRSANISQQKRDSVISKEIGTVKKVEPPVTSKIKFETRINSVLKTIPLKAETFTVDFYDNGEIDGDTISVFFNGRLVLSHKMLTDKPLTLTLKFDEGKPVNELVMYAESLGSIPPNTALMVLHDGEERYEARIESDLGRNGTIRFTHKPK